MRRTSTLALVIGIAVATVAGAPAPATDASTEASAVVRWDAASTAAERDAVLDAVGAVRVRSLSTVHDVDIVAALAGSTHDVELHDHVVAARAEVADRQATLEQARARVAGAEAAVATAGPETAEQAAGELAGALDDAARAQVDLDAALAELADERHRHGDALVKALHSEEHVRWAEERLAGDLGDDRFHAWPAGLHADRFHAWPSGQPVTGAGGLPGRELPTAHGLATGVGVTVAVLDTGAPSTLEGSAAGYDFVDDDRDPTDEARGEDGDRDGIVDEAHGHGGVVADTVRAVAPDARVIHYRVLDADGVGDPHAIALALEDAVARGVDIVNLSAGSDTRYASRVVRDAFKDAEDAGVVVVAAAGNAGSEDKRYPAAEKGVVAVAALDHGGALASFSSRGKWAELAAPGVDVAGVLPDGRQVTWSGSSFAAPRVSGQFALLRELRPDLDTKGLRHLVRDTARSLDGHGRAVDLLASIYDRTDGAPLPGDVCADGRRPSALSLRNTTGGDVLVRVTDKADPSDDGARLFFSGAVDAGTELSATAALAGEQKLPSDITIHVHAPDGTYVRSVVAHVSCSRSLFVGLTVEGFTVTGFALEGDAVVATAPMGAVTAGDAVPDDHRVDVVLTNFGADTRLVTAELRWPDANGVLKKVKLDGDTLFDDDTAGPVLALGPGQWHDDADRRVLPAGQQRVLRLEFDGDAAPAGHVLVLTFDDGRRAALTG